jgi:hypothetical protein
MAPTAPNASRRDAKEAVCAANHAKIFLFLDEEQAL